MSRAMGHTIESWRVSLVFKCDHPTSGADAVLELLADFEAAAARRAWLREMTELRAERVSKDQS